LQEIDMAMMTAAQAKGLTFEKVWAMFQESDARMKQSKAEYDQQMKQSKAEYDERQKKLDARMDKLNEQLGAPVREAARPT
jgi:Skp family chaperone for outer membrane proteins